MGLGLLQRPLPSFWQVQVGCQPIVTDVAGFVIVPLAARFFHNYLMPRPCLISLSPLVPSLPLLSPTVRRISHRHVAEVPASIHGFIKSGGNVAKCASLNGLGVVTVHTLLLLRFPVHFYNRVYWEYYRGLPCPLISFLPV